jgi:hypothetical protein
VVEAIFFQLVSPYFAAHGERQGKESGFRAATPSCEKLLLDQTVRYVHISSNTTIYEVVCYLLYVKHNYMFRPQMLAVFRLYNENLSISYTCVCRGCIGCREGV